SPRRSRASARCACRSSPRTRRRKAPASSFRPSIPIADRSFRVDSASPLKMGVRRMRVARLAAAALAGAIVGVAAAYLFLQPSLQNPAQDDAGAAPATLPDGAPPRSPAASTVEPGPLPTSDRFAVYAYAAKSTEPDELESLIHSTAALAPSHRRTFELDALLVRLAELDVARAVRFARTLRLPTEHLVPLFQLWAEQDAGEALAALRDIDNPATVREIALALIDVLGGDERALERIAAVLSPAQVPAF